MGARSDGSLSISCQQSFRQATLRGNLCVSSILCSNHGFSPRELTTIRNELHSRLAKIVEAWDEQCH
jgi:hypothetical protein